MSVTANEREKSEKHDGMVLIKMNQRKKLREKWKCERDIFQS